MKTRKLVVTVCFVMLFFGLSATRAESADATLRVLHVMSYHATWKWNTDQLQGFKSALAGLDVAYQVVELDTKRNSNPEDIAKKVAQAERIIRDWKPDLIYANDDNAQKYLALRYVNSDIPIVFSAVNRDPSEYNYIGADNVTGVLEHEHVVPTIRLLRKLVPEVKRIAVIVDSDPTWKGVMARLRNSLRQVPDIEVTDWVLVETLSQFKEKMTALQDQVDAVAMLGVFNIKDEAGNDVDYEIIHRWVVENSRLPDFSFWQTRVDRGTLCAVAVSGYEQGLLAGEMARKILLDGETPAAIPIRPSSEGQPMISLARARRLGLMPDVSLLLDTETLVDFVWER